MAFSFLDLDQYTRKAMVEELELDLKNGTLYLSERLSRYGKEAYTDLLRKAMLEGNDQSLAEDLRRLKCFNPTLLRKKQTGGFSEVKMPVNAPETLAEGEFNRFYIRAICRRSLVEAAACEVYRAKEVSDHRIESVQKIGKQIDPSQLLEDLRTHPGVDTALGLPAGPNSGLSIKIKILK